MIHFPRPTNHRPRQGQHIVFPCHSLNFNSRGMASQCFLHFRRNSVSRVQVWGGWPTLTTAFVKGMPSISPGVNSSFPRALVARYASVTSFRSLCWISGRFASSQNAYDSYKTRVNGYSPLNKERAVHSHFSPQFRAQRA